MIKALILQERPLESQEPPLANAPSLELAVSKPCLAGKQTGVCSFPCQVTPALLPPFTCPAFLGKKSALLLPAAPSAAAAAAGPTSPAAPWERLLLQWTRGRLTKAPTYPCWVCYLKLSKQTIRHNTPVTTGEEGKVVQKFQRAH